MSLPMPNEIWLHFFILFQDIRCNTAKKNWSGALNNCLYIIFHENTHSLKMNTKFIKTKMKVTHITARDSKKKIFKWFSLKKKHLLYKNSLTRITCEIIITNWSAYIIKKHMKWKIKLINIIRSYPHYLTFFYTII